MSKLHLGDCVDVMRSMPDNSIDAVITDPPYGLAFMGVAWDTFGDGRKGGARTDATFDKVGGNHHPTCAADQARTRRSENEKFQAAMTPVFEEALRVAKPGAHLLCFGGARTYHRMTCAIEDAGWEVRDCIMWVYGSGFPKSMDVAKAIDKAKGAKRPVVAHRETDPQKGFSKKKGMGTGAASIGDEVTTSYDITAPATDEAKRWEGWGTCLKPAWEPIIVARKPLDGTVTHNVLTWGVGALNIDACRVGFDGGTRAANFHGETGNVYGNGSHPKNDKQGIEKGRFPANLVHDGSQMVLDLFPQSKGQQGDVTGNEPSHPADGVCYGEYNGRHTFAKRGDTGSAARFFNTLRDGEKSAERTYTDRGGTNFAAKPGMRREPTSADRFFYCAKASKKDRGEGNNHPTVKPTALMEWLVKLVTPEGGTVLDPFMGSGTTGVACANLGRYFIGIEREWQYMQIAGPRIAGREREFGMYEST